MDTLAANLVSLDLDRLELNAAIQGRYESVLNEYTEVDVHILLPLDTVVHRGRVLGVRNKYVVIRHTFPELYHHTFLRFRLGDILTVAQLRRDSYLLFIVLVCQPDWLATGESIWE